MSVRNSAASLVRFGRGWIIHICRLHRFFLVAVASVAAVGTVCLFTWMWTSEPCGERLVRLGGLLVQLLGFLIVAYGIFSKTRIFRNSGFFGPLSDWWRRRPRLGPRNIVIKAEGIAIGTSFGTARARVTVAPNASLDVKVSALEKGIDMLFNELDRLDSQVKINAKTAEKEVRNEQTQRETEDANIQRRLDEAIVGSIHLEVSGVALFVLGIIAGTASPEISWLFGIAPSCTLSN